MLRMLNTTRYLTPLREGGSLPAVVEADDGQRYVIKFSGAGQGPKVLIAEIIAGELARALGFRVPELVLLNLDAVFGRQERHDEIRDLLNASVGLNLGMAYLASALAFNPMAEPAVSAEFASDLVWFDAFVTNVDRTARNVNMLVWQEQVWLIDHGAALYFHYDWADYQSRAELPFARIRDHVLLDRARELSAADARLRPLITPELLAATVDLVPEGWLGDEPQFADPAAHRQAYVDYLQRRLASSNFVEEAIRAHAERV